eukprot:7383793-Pyramimonas_sp.AAC.1
MSAKQEADKSRVWFGGFPRRVLGSVMQAHAQFALSKLPTSYSIGAEIPAKNMQMSCSIRFSSSEIASNVVQQMKSHGVDWIDPRTKVAIAMRCRLDASAAVRARRKALGRLWQALLNH